MNSAIKFFISTYIAGTPIRLTSCNLLYRWHITFPKKDAMVCIFGISWLYIRKIFNSFMEK